MPAELASLLGSPRAFEMRPTLPIAISPGAGKEASEVYGRLRLMEGIGLYSGSGGGIAPLRLEALRDLRLKTPRTVPARVPSGEQALFQNRARLKVMTSTVAMHLPQATRSWLFEALDDLLSVEMWHEEDALLNPSSFATYLRLLVYQGRVRRASLGISNIGNLLAAWMTATHRLTIEFFPSDRLRWALSCGDEETREVAAGQCGLRRLSPVLTPYDAIGWFVEDANADRP
jgi:hypothetical protein